MSREVEKRFRKTEIDGLEWAGAVRKLGVKAKHVYVLRQRIDCSHWHHVKDLFLRPTPRRHVTTRPKQVISAMRRAGLW